MNTSNNASNNVVDTYKNAAHILTIENTNNSTAQVTGIKVTGNRLVYTTVGGNCGESANTFGIKGTSNRMAYSDTHAQGFVELIDSTGSYAAENFIAWVKETVTTKQGTEGALIALVTRYIEEQRGSVELRTFQFNAYI